MKTVMCLVRHGQTDWNKNLLIQGTIDNPLNDYYRKKRDQGKHHLSAVGAVSNKLTTIIYAILRDSKPYKPLKFV